MTDSEDVYRVRTVDPGANAKSTKWVRATSRLQAKHYVEKIYSREVVRGCAVRTPPADARIHDAAGVQRENWGSGCNA